MSGEAIGFRPSQKVARIGVSEILRIGAVAAAHKRAGRDVIILGAGEPDFDTPDHVKDAAQRAMHEGATKYTALDGAPDLKAAVREKFGRENALFFDQDEITIASGAKQLIFNAMMASLDLGDEVVIPAPYWVSYIDIVRIAGGTPVIAPTSEADGFRLRPDALARVLTPRTRWLILNAPANPTGAVYSPEELRALLAVVKVHPDVWILSDDIYEHIVYDGRAMTTAAAVEPSLKRRTLTVNGVSKAYAMTGWRIGYAGGPKPLIEAMAVVQSQATSCPCSVSQAAALAALRGPQDFLAERRRSFQARRDLVVTMLNRAPGVCCREPEGAFYVFPSCAEVIGRRTSAGAPIESDADFCAWLLESAGVAVVPGSAFGRSGYFRISYATSTHELERACTRIVEACATLEA